MPALIAMPITTGLHQDAEVDVAQRRDAEHGDEDRDREYSRGQGATESISSVALRFGRPLAAEASPDIHVGGIDQVAKSCDVALAARPQFDMPHAFAAALQQTRGIIQACPLV